MRLVDWVIFSGGCVSFLGLLYIIIILGWWALQDMLDDWDDRMDAGTAKAPPMFDHQTRPFPSSPPIICYSFRLGRPLAWSGSVARELSEEEMQEWMEEMAW